MVDVIDFLNRNVGSFSVVLSAVVAASTVAYAILTASLVRETKTMRRAETEPALAVYLTPYSRWINFFELVIHNHGRGIARNVRWRSAPPPESLRERGVEIHSLALLGGLSQLAPGQQLRSFFGSAVELLKEPPLEPLVSLLITRQVRGITSPQRSSSMSFSLPVSIGSATHRSMTQRKLSKSWLTPSVRWSTRVAYVCSLQRRRS